MAPAHRGPSTSDDHASTTLRTEAPSRVYGSGPGLGSCRLLLVEDDKGTLVRLLDSLDHMGAGEFRVETAGTLAEAQKAMGATDFDAVVLDLGLPDSRGVETLASIREDHPVLPIVLYTGDQDPDLVSKAADLGVHEVMVKGDVGIHSVGWAAWAAIRRQQLQHLEEVRETTRPLARWILKDPTVAAAMGPAERRALGRRIADGVGVHPGVDLFETFSELGLGGLVVNSAAGTTWRFEGHDLLEVNTTQQGQPSCYLVLGFLECMIGQLNPGTRPLGMEVSCRTMGEDKCSFLIDLRPVPSEDGAKDA